MIFNESGRSINRFFKKNIDNKEKDKIKTTWVNALEIDPTFENWKIEFDYQNKNFPEGWDPHIELTPLIYDESKWNKEYWNKLKKDLNKNCSRERLEFMIKVAQVYMADKIELVKKVRAKHSTTTIPKKKDISMDFNQLRQEKEKYEKMRMEEFKKYNIT